MAPNKKKAATSNEVQIMTVERGIITFNLLGTTPLLHNRLSQKAKQELLMPAGPKTKAEKKVTLKHVPIDEYRASPYTNPDDKAKTLIQHLSSAFRGAMRSAALDLPGITKAEIGRLLWVEGDRIDIFGVPELDMRVVRQAGMTRAPDIRTRAIMPEWACRITVSFTQPQLKQESVANLLAAAGTYIGVGDYRNEKGAGNYGLWELVDDKHPAFKSLIKYGGRKAQMEAMESPGFFDNETEELFSWFEEEVKNRRTFAPMTKADADGKGRGGKKKTKTNGQSAEA